MASVGSQTKEVQEKHKKVLASILKLSGNDECMDCTTKNPSWASINLGIFLCSRCAGLHRQIGVHISQVRSTTLDLWKPEWINRMKSIGNIKAKAVYEALLPYNCEKPDEQEDAEVVLQWIRTKYESKKYWSGQIGAENDSSKESKAGNKSSEREERKKAILRELGVPSPPPEVQEVNQPRKRGKSFRDYVTPQAALPQMVQMTPRDQDIVVPDHDPIFGISASENLEYNSPRGGYGSPRHSPTNKPEVLSATSPADPFATFLDTLPAQPHNQLLANINGLFAAGAPPPVLPLQPVLSVLPGSPAQPGMLPSGAHPAISPQFPGMLPMQAGAQPALLPAQTPGLLPTQAPQLGLPAPGLQPGLLPAQFPPPLPSSQTPALPAQSGMLPTTAPPTSQAQLGLPPQPGMLPQSTVQPSLPQSQPGLLPTTGLQPAFLGLVPGVGATPLGGLSPAQPAAQPGLATQPGVLSAHPQGSPGVLPIQASAGTLQPGLLPTQTPQLGLPTQTSGLLPTQTPGLLPTQTPGLLPTQTPGLLPTQTPGLLPTQTPGLLPTQAPGLLPTQAPGLLPTQAPGLLPTQAPQQLGLPTQTPGLIPTSTPQPGLLPTQFTTPLASPQGLSAQPGPGMLPTPGLLPTPTAQPQFVPQLGLPAQPGPLPAPQIAQPGLLPTTLPQPGLLPAPGVIPPGGLSQPSFLPLIPLAADGGLSITPSLATPANPVVLTTAELLKGFQDSTAGLAAYDSQTPATSHDVFKQMFFDAVEDLNEKKPLKAAPLPAKSAFLQSVPVESTPQPSFLPSASPQPSMLPSATPMFLP